MLKFSHKIILKESDKYVTLLCLSRYYAWETIKKVSAKTISSSHQPVWSDTFSLPDGSYSVPDIQDSFDYIIEKKKRKKKKNETVTTNLPI